MIDPSSLANGSPPATANISGISNVSFGVIRLMIFLGLVKLSNILYASFLILFSSVFISTIVIPCLIANIDDRLNPESGLYFPCSVKRCNASS